MRYLFIAIFILGTNIIHVSAHVGLDFPIGGETFVAKDTIVIKWHVEIPHDQKNWDLYLSKDNGNTWEIITSDIPNSQLEYGWKVPDNFTEAGRIKIVQDNSDVDYEDISSNFKITGTTSISKLIDNQITYCNVFPNPFRVSTNFKFHLDKNTTVILEIMNLDFSWHTIIVNGFMNEGDHIQNWNATDMPPGFYIYYFQSDENIKTGGILLIN